MCVKLVENSAQERNAVATYSVHFNCCSVTWCMLFAKRKKKMFYLTMHSTHFIYGYMTSDMWQSSTQIAREDNRYKGYFTDWTPHIKAFVIPDQSLERDIAQWVHHNWSIRRPIGSTIRDRPDDPSHHRATSRSYLLTTETKPGTVMLFPIFKSDLNMLLH